MTQNAGRIPAARLVHSILRFAGYLKPDAARLLLNALFGGVDLDGRTRLRPAARQSF